MKDYIYSLLLFRMMDLFNGSKRHCAFRRKTVQFGIMGNSTGFGSQTIISLQVSRIVGCVSSGQSFHLSKPQFPHL